MRASNALIAWTPAGYDGPYRATAGQVAVGPLLQEGERDWTAGFAMTGGAAYANRQDLDGWQQTAMVFIDFNTLVGRDGIAPEAAHEAFLAIDEYRWHISPDMAGAEEQSG